MKRLLIATLASFIVAKSFGQEHTRSINLSIEPTFLINKLTYSPYNQTTPLLLESKRKMGFAFNAAYQKDFRKNLFYTVGLHILLLRNAVDLHIEESGFNDKSEIKYGRASSVCPFDYFTGIGVGGAIGYRSIISETASLTFSAGGHFDFPLLATLSNSVVFSTGHGFAGLYAEDYSGPNSFQSVYIGFDITTCYNFLVRQKVPMCIGLHASVDPGQKIEGRYFAYPQLTPESTGTLSLSKSYVGLILGVNIPKGKK